MASAPSAHARHAGPKIILCKKSRGERVAAQFAWALKMRSRVLDLLVPIFLRQRALRRCFGTEQGLFLISSVFGIRAWRMVRAIRTGAVRP